MREITVNGYIRVDKRVAKGMFEMGKEVIMCASNMRLEYGISMVKDMQSFDVACNNFSYYNCNKETGHRINFFVKEEDKKNYDNVYYWKNREKILQKSREYYIRNKERIKLRFKKYREKNKDVLYDNKMEYYKKRRYGIGKRRWWTDYEIDMIMEHNTTDDNIAKEIGRSVQAIQVKRSKINSGLD